MCDVSPKEQNNEAWMSPFRIPFSIFAVLCGTMKVAWSHDVTRDPLDSRLTRDFFSSLSYRSCVSRLIFISMRMMIYICK